MAPSGVWSPVAAALVLLLHILPLGAAQCYDAASATTCAAYLGVNGWSCAQVIATGVTVGDMCQRSCGRCGTGVVVSPGNAACWKSGRTFSSCCNMATSNVGLASCWVSGGPTFETCCLNKSTCTPLCTSQPGFKYSRFLGLVCCRSVPGVQLRRSWVLRSSR
jgi:hypothetical protein